MGVLVSSFALGYGLRENSKQLASNLALMQWFHKKVLTAGAILPFFPDSFFSGKIAEEREPCCRGCDTFW